MNVVSAGISLIPRSDASSCSIIVSPITLATSLGRGDMRNSDHPSATASSQPFRP